MAHPHSSWRYDEPEIIRYSSRQFGPLGADAGQFIELDAAVWSNNTVRVMAQNISAATFDLAATTLSVGATKRGVA